MAVESQLVNQHGIPWLAIELMVGQFSEETRRIIWGGLEAAIIILVVFTFQIGIQHAQLMGVLGHDAPATHGFNQHISRRVITIDGHIVDQLI